MKRRLKKAMNLNNRPGLEDCIRKAEQAGHRELGDVIQTARDFVVDLEQKGITIE